jgi:hypothetical protein
MKTVSLPRTAKVGKETIRLAWGTLSSLDGWWAEVPPKRLRAWENNSLVSISSIERELKNYCDYTRYAQDRNGKTYLCLYVRA